MLTDTLEDSSGSKSSGDLPKTMIYLNFDLMAVSMGPKTENFMKAQLHKDKNASLN